MNAGIFWGMKRKKQAYYKYRCRIFKPTPQWVLAIQRMMTKLDPAEVKKPNYAEIAEYAIGLAQYDTHLGGVAPRIAEVFRWPSWTTPCQDERRIILPLVEKYKKQAEEELRQHYLYHHALSIRRQRWLRAHPPPQARGWTKKPLAQVAPVPRKRIFRPPDRAGFPDTLSPPAPTTQETSTKRPGWRESEGLLCFSLLFGNRIVVREYICDMAFQRADPAMSPRPGYGAPRTGNRIDALGQCGKIMGLRILFPCRIGNAPYRYGKAAGLERVQMAGPAPRHRLSVA